MLQDALANEMPLQIVGVPNAYIALLAQSIGYRAIYLSGAATANFCFGLPDIGLTTLNDLAEETRRITNAVDLPILVDIDTGWGMPDRAAKLLKEAGAAGVHIEDQEFRKRCGHLEGKKMVSVEEMCQRIEDAKSVDDIMIMARTDALAVEGLDTTLERAQAYEKAGADALFAEAFTELEQYKKLRKAISIPILANITEFGKTPLFTVEELKAVGVNMVLYPLSAARAMNKAALETLKDIREHGTQKASIDKMQTRQELYDYLDYEK